MDRCIQMLEQVLEQAGIDQFGKSEISQVILVGGSTKLPRV